MDELLSQKAQLALALKCSRGDCAAAKEIAFYAVKHEQLLSLLQVLQTILVFTPCSVDPSKLLFVYDLVNDSALESVSEGNADSDLDLKNFLQDLVDLDLGDSEIESHVNVLQQYVNQQCTNFKWSSDSISTVEDLQFQFVRSRAFKVAELYSNKISFNDPLYQPVSRLHEFRLFKFGFLEPMNFAIQVYQQKGLELPGLAKFYNNIANYDYFVYLVQYIDSANINEFLIECVVPFVQHNNQWPLLTKWVENESVVTDSDFEVMFKFYDFFFSNYLITQEHDEPCLQFLKTSIESYLFKIYSCNNLNHRSLSLMSDTVQYFISFYEGETETTDHNLYKDQGDQYVKQFCRINVSNLQYLSSLIDSFNKLIDITNDNESLMSITQVLLISESSAEIQLNFAKLLIHNHKINEDLLLHQDVSVQLTSWESFLQNFNWLIENSVIFRKIRSDTFINKINELLFEVLLSLNFNSLIRSYLMINYNNNTFKRILLKHSWNHFAQAKNFNLQKDELLTVCELIENFDLNFSDEIEEANNFFIDNRNSLDIYKDSEKFYEFDSSLVHGKQMKDFANKNFHLELLSEFKDFESCEDLNFEIVKFKKLLIGTNRLILNFKYNSTKPIDIYKLNNPLVVMEKILELNTKSYNDMNKIYKVLVDLCIGMDKIALIYDITLTKYGDFENFDPETLTIKSDAHSTKFPLRDKLISSCIDSALIDMNFEFAFSNSMKLLNNETGTSLDSLEHTWLSVFQVCKFVDPNWMMGDTYELMAEEGDGVYIPLNILTKQIELISKLLEVIPSNTGITITENNIIINQANYLTQKYHKSLSLKITSDFNSYQHQGSNSIFQNFNASTGTLLTQFAKNNASSITLSNRPGVASSPSSNFNSPRNVQTEEKHGLENRFVRAFTSSANEIFHTENQGLPTSVSNSRINLLNGEEQIKNLFSTGLGWAMRKGEE